MPDSQDSKASTKFLDFVLCDLQGPMNLRSVTGDLYFITIMDDASGLSMAQMIRTMEEWKTAVQSMVLQMERITGQIVKRIRG